MEINEDIYDWLVNMKFLEKGCGIKVQRIMESYQEEQKEFPRYQLNQENSLNFESGVIYGLLVQALYSFQSQTLQNVNIEDTRDQLPHINQLKEVQAPAAKIFNWNILVESFKQVGIMITNERKSQILEGNYEILHDILIEIYLGFGNELSKKKDKQNQPQKNKTIDSQDKENPENSLKSSKKVQYQDSIDLARLNPKKEVNNSKNCLEMFILLLCRHLNMTPKQVASLFTNNNKYLAHILAKGVKGDFQPVLHFYQEFYANTNHLMELFESDTTRKSIFFSLNALKPGLISKSLEVAQWTSRLFSKIGYELDEYKLLPFAWDWFSDTQHGGLKTALLGLQRHIDLKELVVSMINMFGKNNMQELYLDTMKKCLQSVPKDLLYNWEILMLPLAEDQLTNPELVKNGIIEQMIDIGLIYGKQAEQVQDQNLLIQVLKFLSECWINFQDFIVQDEQRCTSILKMLEKSVRHKTQPLQVVQKVAIIQLFHILEKFGEVQYHYAPIVYKSISICLLENIRDVQLREIILNNAQILFENLDNIPLAIMVEPMLKAIQELNTSFDFHTFDFQFYAYLARSPRLELAQAVQIMDLLAKLYLNNIVLSQVSYIPLISLIAKYITEKPVEEYTFKLVKIALAMYYSSEKYRKKQKNLPLYNNQKSGNQTELTPHDIEIEIIKSQHRALIVELVKQIVQFQNQDLNEKIKNLTAHTLIQIRQFSRNDNKGMVAILMLFGQNYKELLSNYQQELKSQGVTKTDEHLDQTQLDSTLQGGNNTNNTKDFNVSYQQELSHLKLRKKQTLSKHDQSLIAMKKGVKAEPGALKDLQDIKQKLKEKREEEQQNEVNTTMIMEKQKNNLRKQLEKRSLKQGVAAQNKKDQEAVLTYEFGSMETQLKQEKKTQVDNIDFIYLKEQEFRDKEFVDILLKRYGKLMRFIFTKYSSTSYNNQKYQLKKDFEKLQKRDQEIFMSEVWKVIKFYKLDKYINQQESKIIIRNVNLCEKKQYSELYSLDFEGFWIYFVQLCCYIKRDHQYQPIGINVKEIIKEMREIHVQNKTSTKLFDEPDLAYYGEEDVIKQYNMYLEQNPNYPLPDGYKKTTDKQMEFNYQFGHNFKVEMPDSYTISYEIIQEILQTNIGINSIEPISKIQKSFKAVPKFTLDTKDLKPQYLDHFATKKESSRRYNNNNNLEDPLNQSQMSVSVGGHRKIRSHSHHPITSSSSSNVKQSTFQTDKKPKYGNQRVLNIEPRKQLSLGLKLGISNFNFRDRYTAEQVAYVLDDVIDAVEKGKKEIKSSNKVQNPLIIERKQELEKKQKLEEVYKKKLQERKLMLKESVARNEQIKKERKEKELLKKEQEREQEQEKLLEKQKQRQIYLQKQRSKAKQNREQKVKEKEEEIQKEKENKKQKNLLVKEKIKQLNIKNEENIKKLQDVIKQKVKIEEEKKLKEQEQQKIIEDQNKQKTINTIKKVKEIDRQNIEKISSLIKSSKVQKVLSDNNYKLQFLFQFLVDQTYKKLINSQIKKVPLKSMYWFSNVFKISPEILEIQDIKYAYRSVCRGKKESNSNMGINYEEFLEMLVRIAIKGKLIFNKFAKNLIEGESDDQQEIEDIIKQQEKKHNQNKNNNQQQQQIDSVDDYGDIDQANSDTIQCLLYYLGMPSDKAGIFVRFKQILDQDTLTDKIRKEDLKKKLSQDPRQFIIKSPGKPKKVNAHNVSSIQDKLIALNLIQDKNQEPQQSNQQEQQQQQPQDQQQDQQQKQQSEENKTPKQQEQDNDSDQDIDNINNQSQYSQKQQPEEEDEELQEIQDMEDDWN